MSLTDQSQYRLKPSDEFTHEVESAHNFNESMYVNVFDHRHTMGAWFRVGNRPNEGYAEVTVCVYLPDGRVGFMFQRPTIDNNDRFDAAGLSIEVLEPMQRLAVRYQGKLCLLDDPSDMENPSLAFKNNPLVNAEIDLVFNGCSPVEGGERIDEHGEPVELDPQNAFFRGHYEQHVSGRGTLLIGDKRYSLDGLGLRDHSWGPRYWQSIHWYRWTPLNFTKDFALVSSIVTQVDGSSEIAAMVLRGDSYTASGDVIIEAEYDDRYYLKGYVMTIKLPDHELVVEAEVLSQIPLRNRRTTEDGRKLETRIIEAFTRFKCDGHVGYGMSEFLDQVIDGEPVGVAVC